MPYTEESLDVFVRNVDFVQDRLGRVLLIENPSRYLEAGSSSLSEAEILARLVQRSHCGILLDINNICVGAHNLGKDPTQFELLRRDPSLIPNATNEAVRLGSPIRSLTRTAVRDYELGDVGLPAGARVMIIYASANRDERKFDDVDALRAQMDADERWAERLFSRLPVITMLSAAASVTPVAYVPLT